MTSDTGNPHTASAQRSLILRCAFCLLMLLGQTTFAQVTGIVVDSKTKQPLEYVNVFYAKQRIGELTDLNGKFSIKENDNWNELTVSALGYVTKLVKLQPGKKKNLVIKLVSEPHKIEGVTIVSKKKKYKKENNPAVELMQKVMTRVRTVNVPKDINVAKSNLNSVTSTISLNGGTNDAVANEANGLLPRKASSPPQ